VKQTNTETQHNYRYTTSVSSQLLTELHYIVLSGVQPPTDTLISVRHNVVHDGALHSVLGKLHLNSNLLQLQVT